MMCVKYRDVWIVHIRNIHGRGIPISDEFATQREAKEWAAELYLEPKHLMYVNNPVRDGTEEAS